MRSMLCVALLALAWMVGSCSTSSTSGKDKKIADRSLKDGTSGIVDKGNGPNPEAGLPDLFSDGPHPDIKIAKGSVALVAGSSSGFADGTGAAAKFLRPQGVILDSAGTVLYVGDTNNHRIRAIDLSNNAVTTIAGDGNADFKEGTGTAAEFSYPMGVGFIGSALYVADHDNARIRKIELPGAVVTTQAGSGTQGFQDDYNGLLAKFNNPSGVGTDGNNLIFVADTNNHRIRQVAISPHDEVTTIAGSGVAGFNDKVGTAAQFSSPMAAVFYNNRLYVADRDNNKIRMVDLVSKQVYTVAGTSQGYQEGPGTTAKFNQPWGVAVDSNGIIYVADTGNHRIRTISSTGSQWIVQPLAGTGTSGDVEGDGATAQFYSPRGLVVSKDNLRIYVADSQNHRIRVITVE